MQVNQPKGGTVEATTTPLAVGDEVGYSTIIGGGRSLQLIAARGVITAIDGSVATVRRDNGQSITCPLNKLTPSGQINKATYTLTGGQ